MFRFSALALAVLLCMQSQSFAQFTPSGTFDNPETKDGVVTGYSEDAETHQKKLDKEVKRSNGVELMYKPAPTTKACTKIATIQVMWLTDANGAVKKWKDYPGTKGDDCDREQKISSPAGYWVDGTGKEKTPYYQDKGNGDFYDDMIGSSDGKGAGKPTHTTDAPQGLYAGWTKHFEAWTVCIEGPAAGTVLAGVTWEVGPVTKTDKLGKSKIVDKAPKQPTKEFKDALKAWEDSYNNANPAPNPKYTEPGGGFKF